MNRLARIEARAKAANLTLAASDAVIRLLSPGIRSGLHLDGMPASECRDTRDLTLYAVTWDDEADPAMAAAPAGPPPFLMP